MLSGCGVLQRHVFQLGELQLGGYWPIGDIFDQHAGGEWDLDSTVDLDGGARGFLDHGGVCGDGIDFSDQVNVLRRSWDGSGDVCSLRCERRR